MGSGKVDMDQSDATRMRGLLVEAVTTLCRNGMRYDEEIKVEGLLAITRDQKDILIVNFNKTFTNSSKSLGSKAINDSISCLDHADSEHSDSGNHAQGRLIKKGKRKRRKKMSVGTVSPEKRTKPCRPSEDMDESDASVGTGSDNCSPGSYEITDQKNGNMPDDPTLTEAKRICKVEVHSESEEVIPDGKEQLRSQLAGDLTLDNAEPVGLYAAGVSIPCGDGSQQSSVPVAASSHSQSSYKTPARENSTLDSMLLELADKLNCDVEALRDAALDLPTKPAQEEVEEGICSPKCVDRNGTKMYECPRCPYSTPKRVNMKRHIGVKHHVGKKFECSDCSKVYYNAYHLKKHFESNHLKTKYVCQFCPRVYRSSAGFRLHLREHTGNLNYECPICHKKFLQKHHFEGHVNSHTNTKSYMCPKCGKTYGWYHSLYNHKKTCGKNPRSKRSSFYCEVCGKHFATNSRLQDHILGKHGESRYCCAACGLVFKWRSSLHTHGKRCKASRQKQQAAANTEAHAAAESTEGKQAVQSVEQN